MAAAPAIGNNIRRNADRKEAIETFPVSANAFSINQSGGYPQLNR